MPIVQQSPKNGKTVAKKPPVKKEVEKVYPQVQAKICTGDHTITIEQAKELLGWEEETDEVKFGSDYLLTDMNDNKVRCRNNQRNREFQQKLAEKYCQEHLNKNWQLNGETLIIGDMGQVLSAQHRLAGLIFAEQIRLQDESKWKHLWDEPITMSTIAVFGISEETKVVRTIDNVRPRSFADVLFTEGYFGKQSKAARSRLCRYTENAVKLLWHRVGQELDAYSPLRTHSECLEFVDEHKKLLQCIEHVFTEDDTTRKLSTFIPLGTAAGLLYLMGCSATEDEAVGKYRKSKVKNEKLLDWSKFDDAQSFWVLLAQNDDSLSVVRKALAEIAELGTIQERVGILVCAWNAFSEVGKVVKADIKLDYSTDEAGIKHLTECPEIKGIDFGDPKESEEQDPDISEEDIEEAKELAHSKRKAKQDTDPSDETDELDDAIDDGYIHEFNEEGEELVGMKPKAKGGKKSKPARKS